MKPRRSSGSGWGTPSCAGRRDLQGGLGVLRAGARPVAEALVVHIEERRKVSECDPICSNTTSRHDMENDSGAPTRPPRTASRSASPFGAPIRRRATAAFTPTPSASTEHGGSGGSCTAFIRCPLPAARRWLIRVLGVQSIRRALRPHDHPHDGYEEPTDLLRRGLHRAPSEGAVGRRHHLHGDWAQVRLRRLHRSRLPGRPSAGPLPSANSPSSSFTTSTSPCRAVARHPNGARPRAALGRGPCTFSRQSPPTSLRRASMP